MNAQQGADNGGGDDNPSGWINVLIFWVRWHFGEGAHVGPIRRAFNIVAQIAYVFGALVYDITMGINKVLQCMGRLNPIPICRNFMRLCLRMIRRAVSVYSHTSTKVKIFCGKIFEVVCIPLKAITFCINAAAEICINIIDAWPGFRKWRFRNPIPDDNAYSLIPIQECHFSRKQQRVYKKEGGPLRPSSAGKKADGSGVPEHWLLWIRQRTYLFYIICLRIWRKTIQTAKLPSKRLRLQLQACTATLQRYRAEAAETAAAMSAAVFTKCSFFVWVLKNTEATTATCTTTTVSLLDRASDWVRSLQ